MRPGGPSVEAVAALARAVFPPAQPLTVERVEVGVSTYIYRIGRGDERFYLRVLPEVGDSFAPEWRTHTLLRERGVSVPEVVYFEHLNEAFGMSVLVTTELPGCPIALAGLDALEKSDVVVFFTRRLQIDGESLELVKKYVNSKKPIVGIRTASHGFHAGLKRAGRFRARSGVSRGSASRTRRLRSAGSATGSAAQPSPSITSIRSRNSTAQSSQPTT